MSRFSALSLSVLLLAGSAAAAEEQASDPDAARAKVEQWIGRFETKDRPKWQKPSVVLRVMGIEEGDRVADVGTGTGYFLPFLSSMVTQTGKVYAVDIDPDMLAYVKTRKFPQDNVETVLAAPDDPKLPEHGLDAILLVDTWHHIEDRKAYIKQLGRALDPYGRVGIVDFYKKELPVGPPVPHKLDRETVLREFREAGWDLLTESTALPYQYFLVLAPHREQRPLSEEPLTPTE